MEKVPIYAISSAWSHYSLEKFKNFILSKNLSRVPGVSRDRSLTPLARSEKMKKPPLAFESDGSNFDRSRSEDKSLIAAPPVSHVFMCVCLDVVEPHVLRIGSQRVELMISDQ